jgi:hypothetical protein
MNYRSEYRPCEVQVLGHNAVLLRDAAVLDALKLVERAIRVSPDSPHLGRFRELRRELALALDPALVSPRRNDEAKSSAVEADSRTCEDGQTISAADAAKLLGVTPRRVQQLALLLGGQRLGRVWCLDRALVLAHRDFQQQRNEDRRAE